jgi:hypothetical protein
MPAVATERLSDRKLLQSTDGKWTAQLGYDVIGYVDEDTAIGACPVQEGSPHPRSSGLTCTKIQLMEDKLTMAHVVANFEVDADSTQLNSPPSITWKWAKVSQPVETDLNGNGILNSAGDAFTSKASRQFAVRYLTITRNEPYYDQAVADQYTDTTNSDSISFEGITYNPGQVYCMSYAPTGAYHSTDPYVTVAYAFEIRSPNYSNLTPYQIRYPFQLRLLDQGQRGIYNDTVAGNTFGHFYLCDHTQVTHDILLFGDGTPNDDAILVTAGGLQPVSQTLPTTVLSEQVTLPSGYVATYLIYQLYSEIPFAGLGSQFNTTY